MVRLDLLEKANENRKQIERVLATSGKRGMTLSEIAKAVNLPITTVKRHLEKLISIGRVHVEGYAGFNVYIWNGEEQGFQRKIHLSHDHVIFIDAMINPWGQPFIRIKESKRNSLTNEWETVGAVLISKNCIDDFLKQLAAVSGNLDKYGEQ